MPTTTANTGSRDPIIGISTTLLWNTAIDKVKTTEQWKRYTEIIEKKLTRSTSSIKTPNDIQSTAEEIRDTLENSRLTLRLAKKRIVVREVLDNIVSFIATINDVGAAVTSLNPYASTAWGGIQFIVQAAVTGHNVRELCWQSLPRMLDLTCRYQTFEELYQGRPDHPQSATIVKGQLLQLYGLILEYHMAVVIYVGSKRELLKVAFLGSSNKVQAFLDDIKDKELNLQKTQLLADREIGDAQFKTTVRLSENLQALVVGLRGLTHDSKFNIDKICQELEFDRRSKILDWISPIEYETTHTLKEKTAMDGTGQWIFINPDYETWRTSNHSMLFWLHGFMGCGKSCLAHVVIDRLKAELDCTKGDIFAYFYCDGSGVDGILRCLLKQLVQTLEGTLMNEAVEAYNEKLSKGRLSEEDCVQMILALACDSKSTTIIIDGMDECESSVQKDLVGDLEKLFESSTSPLHVFLSSRYEQDIIDFLEPIKYVSVAADENNGPDLTKMIRTEVEEASQKRPRLYRPGTPEDQTETVIQRLENGAQRMFRWVRLSLDYLHSSANTGEMTLRMKELSQLKTLFDLYDVIYQNIIKNRDEKTKQVVEVVFVFVLYGAKWATMKSSGDVSTRSYTEHISIALAWKTRQAFSSTMYKIEDIRAQCRSFITFANSEFDSPYLTVPHFSVIEYLRARHAEVYDFSNGHMFLARLCMEVFDNSRIPDRAARLPQNAFTTYCASEWIRHILSAMYGSTSSVAALQEPSKPLATLLDMQPAFRDIVDSFLLKCSAPPGFAKWARFLRELPSLEEYPHFENFILKPKSTLFVRILLNYRWRELYSEAAACSDLTFHTPLRTSAKSADTYPKISIPAYAAVMGNLKAFCYMLNEKSIRNIRILEIEPWLNWFIEHENTKLPSEWRYLQSLHFPGRLDFAKAMLDCGTEIEAFNEPQEILLKTFLGQKVRGLHEPGERLSRDNSSFSLRSLGSIGTESDCESDYYKSFL
ncbi:hypothetical protein V8E51_013952 [Hyaloscypha variabilis]